jgi:hypothetical protein
MAGTDLAVAGGLRSYIEYDKLDKRAAVCDG